MKRYNRTLFSGFYGILFACCGWQACSDGGSGSTDPQPEVLFTLSESEVHADAEGYHCQFIIQAEGDWRISGNNDWCKVDRNRGNGTDTVGLSVDRNVFREERCCELKVKLLSDGEQMLSVKQKGASRDYLYRLPVIFHVLYQDAADINQNIHKNYLENILTVCNAVYRQGHNGLDMGVEFYMAVQDPAGKILEEPGIDRVQWSKSNVSAYDFIESTEPEDVSIIWDPFKYINVVVFPFAGQSGLAAISTMPFTVSADPLKGLRIGDVYFDRVFSQVYCIAFNTQYIIRPGAGNNLAHELGHYLGLFHVFSDSDQLQTDYCGDTPNYNRASYMEERKRILESEGVDSPRLYERKNDAGETFISRNVMDYEYTYQDEFTRDQYKRIRHVLENSPLVPGVKKNRNGI